MKLILLVPAAVSVLAFGHIALQGASYTAKAPSGQTLSIVAVCQVTSESIGCWNPGGAPDPRDTEYVSAVFIANPDLKLQLAYKGRTRLIVTSEVIPQNGQSAYFDSMSDGSGRILTEVRQQGNSSPGQEMRHLYWYYPSESDSVVDLSIGMTTRVENIPKIELKTGATAKIGNTTMKIDSIRPADRASQNPFGYEKGPQWDVLFSLTPDSPSTPTVQLYVTAIGQDDKSIPAVDDKGNPAKPKPERGYPQLIYQYMTSRSGGTFRSSVKPDRVKYLSVNATYRSNLTIAGIHLDPNPSTDSR